MILLARQGALASEVQKESCKDRLMFKHDDLGEDEVSRYVSLLRI
jgi:hypothetical protein